MRRSLFFPRLAFGLTLVLGSAFAQDVEQLRVLALFTDKAMVEINGRSTLLVVGQPSPEGVELISADFEEAVIEVNGQRASYNLSDRVSAAFVAVRDLEVQIPRHISGSYMTAGIINGRRVEMMVDTGATAVAMSETEAQRLAIPYRERGTATHAETASGIASAWLVELDSVRVGEIELHRVGALVVQGDSPRMVLLGMTFLGQVDLLHQGNLMILRRR